VSPITSPAKRAAVISAPERLWVLQSSTRIVGRRRPLVRRAASLEQNSFGAGITHP
jgi:hypothetical protein